METIDFYFKSIDLNNIDNRKEMWKDKDFRKTLSEYVGKVIEKEEATNWEIVSDFFQWNDYFMLSFLWLDIERFIYEDVITVKNLGDGFLNGYAEFVTEESRYTNNLIPNLEATYY